MLIFNDQYYKNVIEKNNYEPLDFEPIDFGLQGISHETLEKKWLCHHDGRAFSEGLNKGENCVITTGIGLSGMPHLGTIAQIMRAIFLQQNGLKVQFVLGDLDSYNARNQSLEVLSDRTCKYREFIINLGFDTEKGILRTQRERLDVLLTSYLIANCIRDEDFLAAEEDLSDLYQKKGIYAGMIFPVKQAILLMIADFVNLGLDEKNQNVMVMLGLEEHMYVRLAKLVLSRMEFNFKISGIYSRIIKGFNNYPKMSKSIPGSGISIDMEPSKIRSLTLNNEGHYKDPLDSVVYQMMCSVSNYSPGDLDYLYDICSYGGDKWQQCKEDYINFLLEIFKKWPTR